MLAHYYHRTHLMEGGIDTERGITCLRVNSCYTRRWSLKYDMMPKPGVLLNTRGGITTLLDRAAKVQSAAAGGTSIFPTMLSSHEKPPMVQIPGCLTLSNPPNLHFISLSDFIADLIFLRGAFNPGFPDVGIIGIWAG